MPAAAARREAIAVAIESYNRAHAESPLPRPTARLLAVMFGNGEVCQQSLENLAAEGFNRTKLPVIMRRLVEAGFMSRHQTPGRQPFIYRLHLSALVPA